MRLGSARFRVPPPPPLVAAAGWCATVGSLATATIGAPQRLHAAMWTAAATAVVAAAVPLIPWSRRRGAAVGLAWWAIAVLIPFQALSVQGWDPDHALVDLLPLTWLAVHAGRRATAVGVAIAVAVAWTPVIVGGEAGRLPLIALAVLSTALVVLVATTGQRLLERRRMEGETAALARRDPVSGLANRLAFDEAVSAQLAPDRTAVPVHVLLLDLDGFKAYNEDRGHVAGDVALAEIGRRWTSLTPTAGLLARIGGDEFGAVVMGVDAVAVRALAERLVQTLPDGLDARAGIAAWDGTEGPAELVGRADAALYAAKRAGGSAHVGVAGDGGDALTRWHLRIPALIRDRAVRSVYQPIVDLADRRLCGCEALARATGDAAGAPTDQLFDNAQRSGLAGELDAICRRAAVEGAVTVTPGVDLWINVGVGLLLEGDGGLRGVLELLREFRRPPGTVILEINEAINGLERFSGLFRRYREAGLRLALDDVGEGFSTIESLSIVDPDAVKLARSLTATADRPEVAAVIRGLVAVAARRNTLVIAEGIETEAECEAVRVLGVGHGQGWLFGRPGPVSALTAPGESRSVSPRRRSSRRPRPQRAAVG